MPRCMPWVLPRESEEPNPLLGPTQLVVLKMLRAPPDTPVRQRIARWRCQSAALGRCRVEIFEALLAGRPSVRAGKISAVRAAVTKPQVRANPSYRPSPCEWTTARPIRPHILRLPSVLVRLPIAWRVPEPGVLIRADAFVRRAVLGVALLPSSGLSRCSSRGLLELMPDACLRQSRILSG